MSAPTYSFPKYRFVPESVPAVITTAILMVFALTWVIFSGLQAMVPPHINTSLANPKKQDSLQASASLALAASPTPAPTAIPTPTPIPTPTFYRPVRLRIPTLGIDTAIEHVGTTIDGAMDVPKDYANVAWYAQGARPGQSGSSVIAGHLDTGTGDIAIFYYLNQLPPGERFEVVDETGRALSFRVVDKRTYSAAAFPIDEVFNQTDGASRLNLITCQGTWDHNSGTYSDRLVVYAIME